MRGGCARMVTAGVLACGLAGPAEGARADVRGSAQVAALQVALRAVGTYDGSVDGHAGPLTRRSVVAFQRRRGLAVDGVAGPATRRALGRRGRPAYAARAIGGGARGWDVAALQYLLAWRGFPSGPIDGGYGPRTAAAVIRYQRWAGLAPDGTAGPATLGSLHRAPPRSPLRLAWPLAAPVGDAFGPRGARFHSGIDLVAPQGATVAAAGAGRVVSAGWDAGGYGNLVVVAHGAGVTTWYAHLERIDVAGGQVVAAGTPVGQVGATGHATGPHLHFEVRLRGAVTDPLTALGG